MRWKCFSDLCGGREFMADSARCPECGASKLRVFPLAIVHLLLADGRGRVVGVGGKRYRCWCDMRLGLREVAARRHGLTVLRESATCLECLEKSIR